MIVYSFTDQNSDEFKYDSFLEDMYNINNKSFEDIKFLYSLYEDKILKYLNQENKDKILNI